jgi:cytoskeletal protein CcmA (bactofilin family)
MQTATTPASASANVSPLHSGPGNEPLVQQRTIAYSPANQQSAPATQPSSAAPSASLAGLFTGKAGEMEVAPPVERVVVHLDRDLVTSVLSKKSRMNGDLDTEEGYRVDGELNGSLTCGTLALINAGAIVRGNVKGKKVVVLGTVEGSIECDGQLILASTAQVNGDVVYNSIVTYQGCSIEGKMTNYKG